MAQTRGSDEVLLNGPLSIQFIWMMQKTSNELHNDELKGDQRI